jgi:hypothetical protein
LSRTARMRRRTATPPWPRAVANSGPCATERPCIVRADG